MLGLDTVYRAIDMKEATFYELASIDYSTKRVLCSVCYLPWFGANHRCDNAGPSYWFRLHDRKIVEVFF